VLIFRTGRVGGPLRHRRYQATAGETFQHVAKVHASRAELKIASRQSGGDWAGHEWARVCCRQAAEPHARVQDDVA
jgi:hypothetical protein